MDNSGLAPAVNGSAVPAGWLARATTALAEARTICDVKAVRDHAEAARRLLANRKDCSGLQNDVAEIKVRAERMLGEMLREMPKNSGGRPAGNRSHDVTGFIPLADLGIGKMDSHRWQTMSRVPGVAVEEYFAGARAAPHGEITSEAVYRLGRECRRVGRRGTGGETGVGCTTADLSALVASGQTFGTVYADPPWAYGNQATRASTDNHYGTMGLDELRQLPVNLLAAGDSHLHLWTTNAFLFECPALMAAWGFEYKSVFVWCKPKMGLGNYWRVSHEFLLLGVRGRPEFRHRGLRSWAEMDRGKHSSKPGKVRHMIEAASPPPYLELFARHQAPGWTVWGNEVERDLFNRGGNDHG